MEAYNDHKSNIYPIHMAVTGNNPKYLISFMEFSP